MMNAVNLMMITLAALVSIAFFTLLERKIISYTQNRKGPNKTMFMGVIQPIADAVKLMNKEINMNYKTNFMLFMTSPVFNIMCSMIMWFAMPIMFSFKFMKMSILFIMSCMSINVIIIMMMSWSANSNYSMLGMMRTISQMISYEVNLMMVMLTIMNMKEQMSMELMVNKKETLPLAITITILFMMWMITILAETNRTPFDFSEGESELISGFNIEFSGKSFMLLFLGEYSSILMLSFITVIMFMNCKPTTVKFTSLYLTICMFFIWTRTTLPRFRYDKMMKINWIYFLPASLILLYISFSIKTY